MSQVIPLVGEMLEAACLSAANLRSSICNVMTAGISEGRELIRFEVTAKEGINPAVVGKYIGALKGRNRDLCIGFGEATDQGIALRVWLDGDAQLVRQRKKV